MYALCTIFTIRRTFFVNPSFFAIFLKPKSTTKACELQDLPKNVSAIMKIIHNGYEYYFIILFEEAAPWTEFVNCNATAHCGLDQSVHTECRQRVFSI